MTGGDRSAATAVITVAYDSDAVLDRFLESLPHASQWPPQVIIADNAPGLGSAAATAERHGATYLPLPENRGYGSAVNAASAILPADVEWILIANPDVELGAAAIDTLVRRAADDASIGAIGPAILNLDGTRYPSARAIPSLRSGIGHALFANTWKDNPWSRSYRGDDEHESRAVGWLSGSCLLVRREAFDRLGGFDEGYFMYFEDVDLGRRLGEAGYRNVFEPEATVVHEGAHSTAGRAEEMISAHHRSARRFVAARYQGPWLSPVRWALQAGLVVRARWSKLAARRRR